MRIDCKAIAARIDKQRLKLIENCTIDHPELVVVHDDDSGSAIYRRMIVKDCDRLGVELTDIDVIKGPDELNWRYNCGDFAKRPVLIQMPIKLPGYDRQWIESHLNPSVDMDGIATLNAGHIYQGHLLDKTNTCTAAAVLQAIYEAGRNYTQKADAGAFMTPGMRVLVIGRSNTVGRPIAATMLRHDATVIVAHSKTPKDEIKWLCIWADVVVRAAPIDGWFDGFWFNERAIVIDVSESCGPDVADRVAYFVGKGNGIGPITRSILMFRVFKYYADQTL